MTLSLPHAADEAIGPRDARRVDFAQFAAATVAPHAHEFDRDERIPETVLRALAEHGYLGLSIPREFGGADADALTCGVLHEEIGRACSSVRSILTGHGMSAAAIHRWGSARQRDRWLPRLARGEVLAAFALTEPLAGSDAAAVSTTALPDGDGFRLHGSKRWITGGQIAGVYLTVAQCDGRPTAFLVPRDAPGLEITPVTGMLGLRGAMLASLELAGTYVQKDAMLGRPGFGVSHVASTALDYGRFSVAWGCVGLAQACLDASVRYTNERHQFGAALRDHQLIRRMLTDMITNVRAARALCERAARARDAGQPEALIETCIAKYFASTAAHRIADDCVQIHGAIGCSAGSPAQRYLRDAKIMEIIEGSTQIQQLTIAEHLFQQ